MRAAAASTASPAGGSVPPATVRLVPAGLLVAAAAGWWWSARMADDMSGGPAMGGMDGMAMDHALSFGGFVVAWAAMMAAMMLPAALPVVRLYARVAQAGRAAPVAIFATGYLVVWSASAPAAYLAWRALEDPLATGEPWAGRLAGGVFVAAALWQLTPLKSVCLRHCRSPLGFFLRAGGDIARPAGALRMGASHAAFCFGCCWVLFALLVTLGTMNLGWMIALTAVIVLEKAAPWGERLAAVAAVAFAACGAVLLADPSLITHYT